MIEIEENLFWDSVARDGRAVKNSMKLIFEKNVYLDDEYGDDDDDDGEVTLQSVLIFGVNPHQRMSIAARIETKTTAGTTTASVMLLNKEKLMELLECVDVRYRENAVFVKHGNVDVRQVGDRLYKVRVCDNSITLSLDALLSLRRKRGIIEMQIAMLERENYELQLYKLLHHFCYDAEQKTVIGALRAATLMRKQILIDELCVLRCKCLQTAFVVEIDRTDYRRLECINRHLDICGHRSALHQPLFDGL